MKNAVIFILITIAIFMAVGFRCADKPEMEVRSYTVQENDTLWSISQKYCPEEMDWREWEYKVKKLNNITDCGNLQENAKIKILEEIKRSDT